MKKWEDAMKTARPVSPLELLGAKKRYRAPFISLFGPDTRTPRQKRWDRILGRFDEFGWWIARRWRIAREWMATKTGA